MALDDVAFARMLVDRDTPRARDHAPRGRHDARRKLARVLALLAPVELLSAMQKMRVRRTPSIQAHVTNRVDHPLLLAADAASAVALGFRELETTVPLLRDAPLNALALLVGVAGRRAPARSRSARSRSASSSSSACAASRPTPRRSRSTAPSRSSSTATTRPGRRRSWPPATPRADSRCASPSGSGAECLMGATEGCSMLYLESRCLAVTRAAGSQGVQNGGIDGVNVAGSVPDGMREVIAENLLRDAARPRVVHRQRHADVAPPTSGAPRTRCRCCSPAPTSCSRASARSRPTTTRSAPPTSTPRTSTTTSSCSATGASRACCARSRTSELLPLRRRAVEALRAVLDELDLARFSDADAEAVVQAHGSLDVPAARPAPRARRGRRSSCSAASRPSTSCGRSRARGYEVEAERVLDMLRQRALRRLPADLGDLRPRTCTCSRRSPTRTTTPGPGTGYRMTAARRAEIGAVRQVWAPDDAASPSRTPHAGCLALRELGPAPRGTRARTRSSSASRRRSRTRSGSRSRA